MLAGSDCSHCESISLASLRSRIAFFSESDPAPSALPFSSSQGPVRKKQQGRGSQRPVESELTSAQIQRASLSPNREVSPVLFSQPDQRPSASASDLVSFGGSGDELADDSMSLAASDAEELSGSVTDPAPSRLPAPSAAKAGMDAKLFSVLSKAVEELGLEWSPPEEPSRSHLDEWFLPGRRQAPQQRPSPFFPEVHDELTRSWRSPYSARLRTSASSALTTIDGAEEKGYEKMPQLDAAHLVSGCTSLPTHCHRLEGEGQPPVQAMQDHFSARWTLLRFSWTGGVGAPLYGPKPQDCPKTAPTQEPAKPAPAVSAPQPAKTQQTRGRSRSARRHPFPKRQGPRPKIALDPAPPVSSWSAGQEEERVESCHGRTAHQKASLKKPLFTPFSSGCRGNCVCCYRARTSAHATVRCDSGKNKTQTFSKREQFSSSVPHECPASVQPATRVYPTPCHAGRGLAGHPRSVRLVYGDNKTMLFTPIRSKTPAFQRRGLHLGAGHARVLHSEVMTLLEKGAIEMVPPALSESGFYSRYFLVPKKDGGLRPILDLRRLNHALMRRPFRMITLKQIHSQIRTGDWFCSLDLKDAYFHIQIAPHHRRFLRFAFEGVAYQYTVLPFGLSLAPRTFTKCMEVALSPLRQMGIRILNYLDDWLILAQSEVELLSHRTLILCHLERLGLRVNFAKSALSPSQRVSFMGTVLDSAHMRAVIAPERALAIQKLAATFKSGTARPLKAFQRMLGLMAAASPVLQLGLLRMRPLQRWLKPRVPHNTWHHGCLHIRVNQACVTALTPWKNPRWMKKGVAMGLVHSRKVVTTDASNTGWGALCEGKPTFGHWSKAEKGFHINCLEMLAVCRACQFFLTDLIGRHVLIRSDNMSVVSYINHQGCVSSKRLFILAECLPEWAQLNLRSLRAAHLPGRLNQGADMLFRSNVPSEEWMLHPQMVQKICKTFGKAEVDLFASKDNSHCPTYYSKDRDALAHDRPNLLLYAFPPIALLPQVVRRVREQGHKVLLVAPLWRNQPWLSELTKLLTAAPWPVPLRQDLLSQANGTIWQPRPKLWALHLWPLDGSLPASQSEC